MAVRAAVAEHLFDPAERLGITTRGWLGGGVDFSRCCDVLGIAARWSEVRARLGRDGWTALGTCTCGVHRRACRRRGRSARWIAVADGTHGGAGRCTFGGGATGGWPCVAATCLRPQQHQGDRQFPSFFVPIHVHLHLMDRVDQYDPTLSSTCSTP